MSMPNLKVAQPGRHLKLVPQLDDLEHLLQIADQEELEYNTHAWHPARLLPGLLH